MKLTGTKRISLVVSGTRTAVEVSNGPWIPQIPSEQIQIRPKGYCFPKEVKDAIATENNSDSREDYFESDRIRLMPGDALYAEALALCS